MIRENLFTRKLVSVVVSVTLITTTFFATINSGSILNATLITQGPTSTSPSETETETVKVAAGGGNATAPWTIFLPQEVRIKAGETVTWYNPTEVGEPHTISFVLDNNTMTDIVSPLGVSNTTEFTALPPGSNNEPLLIPGEDGTNTIIAVNARAFNPTIIDSQGTVNFMSPNANYTMTGDEKYINSGWILPKGLEEEYPGSGNTFAMTFEKPGTYDYLCILHPWQTGTVVVE